MENSRLSKENQIMQVELQRMRSPGNSDGFARAPALPCHNQEALPAARETQKSAHTSPPPLTFPVEHAQKGFFLTESNEITREEEKKNN